MALALNQSLLSENTERPDSEVQKNVSKVSKFVDNVLSWSVPSGIGSAVLNGAIGFATGGVSAAVSGVILGGLYGSGIGAGIGGVQSLWRGLKNWRRK